MYSDLRLHDEAAIPEILVSKASRDQQTVTQPAPLDVPLSHSFHFTGIIYMMSITDPSTVFAQIGDDGAVAHIG